MKNLNIIISISILLMATTTSFSQDKSDDKEAKVGGIRLGWNYSQYFNDGNQLAGTEDYSSFYAGIFKEKKIGLPLLHFGAGIEYYQNAAKINDDNKRVLHYIGVPVYLKAKLGPAFALTGFAPSFKVGEKNYILGKEMDPAQKSHWFDAPFFLGAGVKIAIFTIEARYHWGTIETYENATTNTSIKGQYLQLGAGISF